MRAFLVLWHRFTGWVLLFALSLQAITGIVLTYDHKIDELLNASLLRVEPHGRQYLSLDEIVEAAQSALPDIESISSLRKPRHSKTVYVAYPNFAANSPYYGQKMEVLINPYTAEIIAVRQWGRYFVSILYSFHSTLTSADVGKMIIGGFGIFLLLNIVVGVYLSRPTNKKTLTFYFFRQKVGLSERSRWRRKHIQIGLIIFPVLGLSVLSGVAMTFQEFTNRVLNVPQPQVPISTVTEKRLSIDTLIQNAEAAISGSRWFRISLPPSSSTQAVVVNLREKYDPRRSVGSSSVWLDVSTGEVLESVSYANLSVPQKLAAWFFPVHNGEVLGQLGKVIVILLGIASIWLSLTGLKLRKCRVSA